MRGDHQGQGALFDGLVFFVVMMTASVLVLVSSTTGFQERRALSGKDLVVLTHEYRDVFFSSTIPHATYSGGSGEPVTLLNHTVLDLLLVELSLLDDGVPRESFEGAERVNDEVVALGERLIGQQRFHFALVATFGASVAELYSVGVSGRSDIAHDRTTSSVTASMELVGKQGEAVVELFLW